MDCNVADWWVVLAFEERKWTSFDDIVFKDLISWMGILCKYTMQIEILYVGEAILTTCAYVLWY